jgi:short-subunit dehydrogenase
METNTNKIIVITGSTAGIGFGLADAFLSRECRVVISGRTAGNVDKATAELAARHPNGSILGQACDVSDFTQVQALWDAAVDRLGRVDIWINNAGQANVQQDFWELNPALVSAVVNTNLVGTMYGSSVAMKGMLAQGSGAIYNMEGLGSDGRRIVPGLTLYASTKAGMRYFNNALMKEAEGKPVIVGALLPGMVATRMLSNQYEHRPEEWESAKRMFNLLADSVENVAPWLVERVLANTQNGQRFAYLTGGKIMMRFLTAPFRKRELFE